MRGKILGRALIVMDARSIIAACARRKFRIDLATLAEKICDKMLMDYADCRVILVANEKTDTSFMNAMHFEFERMGMGFQIETEGIYGTDSAIASIMLAHAFSGEITHLVLVSGNRNFAITFSLINQYKKGERVYRIVCMFPFFLHQELRRQVDAIYELGRFISLQEIDLDRPREQVNDDVDDSLQLSLEINTG